MSQAKSIQPQATRCHENELLYDNRQESCDQGRQDKHTQKAEEKCVRVSFVIHRNKFYESMNRIVKDLFIAAIHLSWSWTFFYFFGTYFLSWFLFSLVWYCIGWSHGRDEVWE